MEPRPMMVDVYEPQQACPLIGQSIECDSNNLNDKGYADYLWDGVEGKQQAERKTWSEVLIGLDHVEDQLRREMQAHPDVRLMLILEGLATPEMAGSTVWVPTKGAKRLYHPGKSFHTPLQKVYAWQYQVGKFIEVYCTADFNATVKALVAFYNADQKEGHNTFHRYLRLVDFHPNPQVEGLMNIMKGTNIGPTRAQALINQFGTIWNVLSAEAKVLAEVDGMGLKTAQQLLRKVGRPDA